ncbi:TIGR00730 family Rossman fold protein [Mammaliicoccus stepanovicii]|uniref:Cytokinin riboside 5'-monophosphate phosphoribohydrolase n=1 Tax=Mammaliicoccus stepanovicii TaxID=643214 RepID=A0A240A389_9STAP|nr:TIGR00730 family Rossman fold protein [Mammaliicoccus stepanovicii]PNZ71960.1 TIGR00730 family Rossman fold protein [Mammaliicoccus stepanovicii]GGI39365.1 cytokinin riboside 5'-monophosphate phosphoribohydrolase [Mammaliicoccus stepanovicii]SNV77458.1 decarboxylase [Mammaliicoccus stepanovicii]
MKRIAVFCGASNGNDPIYTERAYEFGKYLAENQYELIYGAGSTGMMGAVANGVLEHNGIAIGIMPKFLAEREIAHDSLSEYHVVETMHERKQMMSDMADAFIMLPGGAGSLEEFFEIYTWSQIGLHHKPIGAFNIHHFFEPMESMIKHLIHTGFVNEDYRHLAVIEEDIPKLFASLKKSQPVKIRDYQK